MLLKLNELIGESKNRYRKLILIEGPTKRGKSALLRALSEDRKTHIINLGITLGQRLMFTPKAKRPILVAQSIKEIIDEVPISDIVLIDNIELLFDRTLHANPLDLLNRNSSKRPVVAVWPGGYSGNRLTYAPVGHPEHQSAAADGIVVFEVT